MGLTPSPVTITVALKPGGEEGYLATAIATHVGAPAARADDDNENPYEAACNALAGVLQQLGAEEWD